MDRLGKLGFNILSFILELESVLSTNIDDEAVFSIISNKGFVNPATFADFIHFFLDHPEFIAAINDFTKPTHSDN